jgi:hypothetical protein
MIARCSEICYYVAAAVALGLAVFNRRTGWAIYRKEPLTVAATVVLLSDQLLAQSLRALAIHSHAESRFNLN